MIALAVAHRSADVAFWLGVLSSSIGWGLATVYYANERRKKS